MWSVCTNCKWHVFETILQIGFVVIMDVPACVYIIFLSLLASLKNCNHGCKSVSVWIYFFAFLTSFLTVCRQELITNSQECIFKASSEQPTGTTDRKGFLSANQMEKPSFLTTWSCRRNTDGEPSRIVFLTAFRSFLTVFGRQEFCVLRIFPYSWLLTAALTHRLCTNATRWWRTICRIAPRGVRIVRPPMAVDNLHIKCGIWNSMLK